jgi:hypothetical protein
VGRKEVDRRAFYGPVGVKNGIGARVRRDESVAERSWEWTEAELEGWM